MGQKVFFRANSIERLEVDNLLDIISIIFNRIKNNTLYLVLGIQKKQVFPIFYPNINIHYWVMHCSGTLITNLLLFSNVFLQYYVFSKESGTMIHYLKNKVGVVDLANAQGLVMFKAQGPKGPAGFEFYQSAGFCKIYYSHFIFEVITFLRKIQNHS